MFEMIKGNQNGMDLPPRPRNGISLCGGGGGLDMGVQLAEPGFHTRIWVEIESHPQQTIIAAQRAGYFAPASIWDDLTTFDALQFAGSIDTLLAGYPCQPFSAAGQRKGEDDPRHLFPHVERVARELGDALNWIILENVPGHVTLGLETVLRTIWDMGFTPAVGLFSASETGAPHERLRMFIVAYRASTGLSQRGSAGFGSSETQDRTGLVAEPERFDRELADSAGRGQRERGDAGEPGRGGYADGESGVVENAICAGTGSERDAPDQQGRHPLDGGRAGIRSGDGSSGANGSASDGRSVDNPQRDGRQAGRDGDHAGNERFKSDTEGGGMADSVLEGLEGHARHVDAEGEPGRINENAGRSAGAGRPSIHPPGPSDHASWGEIVRFSPDLAPAISVGDIKRACDHFAKMVARGELAQEAAERRVRGMASNMAARTRGLKLLGNGVVPITAAYAIRELMRAHGVEPIEQEAGNAVEELRKLRSGFPSGEAKKSVLRKDLPSSKHDDENWIPSDRREWEADNGTPGKDGEPHRSTASDRGTSTPQEREETGQPDIKPSDTVGSGTHQPSQIQASEGEKMRILSDGLRTGSKVQGPSENVFQGLPVCAIRSNPARDKFIEWQKLMRSALSALPTASGPWIWKPPADIQEQIQEELF